MKTRHTLWIVSVVLVFGCVSDRPVRGWIHQAGEGRSLVDFRFVDEQGRARSLRNILGDYTVLALTRCDQDTHRPATALLQEIVAEHSRADYVRVVGIDIHWSEGDDTHAGSCHLIREQRNLASLCDATGAIRRRYHSDDGEDTLYLINPAHRVVQVVSVDDADKLRRLLKTSVAQLSRTRAEELDQEPEELAAD